VLGYLIALLGHMLGHKTYQTENTNIIKGLANALAEREGFSRLSSNLNVFNGFELHPDYRVYQWSVPKSSAHLHVAQAECPKRRPRLIASLRFGYASGRAS
jgi:hypothetical protein